jgi:hypothetical protein
MLPATTFHLVIPSLTGEAHAEGGWKPPRRKAIGGNVMTLNSSRCTALAAARGSLPEPRGAFPSTMGSLPNHHTHWNGVPPGCFRALGADLAVRAKSPYR